MIVSASGPLVLSFLLAAASVQELAPPKPAAQAAAAVAARKWEHESSDLAPNPRIRFGAFENGMRYAWLDHPEPDQRLYVRLHVDAGSFAERDDERGMAHFLEHLAFNGSKHFPPGTLVEWLQKHGLGFGGDTNAMTDFSQTIYMLDLPTSDEAMTKDGLTVMRDVADGLLLLEKEVQAEKGVIDGEERERDSAAMRAGLQALSIEFAGSLVPERLPIGTKAARDAFDAEKVRAFYERWYRPENFTLVVVGDLGGRDPTPQIRAAFADLATPASPLLREPPLGKAKPERQVFVVAERELPDVTIEVQRLRPWVEKPDDRKTRVEDLPVEHAYAMLNLRFAELVKKPETPFLGAQVGRGGGFKVLEGEALRVRAQPVKWREALLAVQSELRRALEHGFAASELDEIRKDELRAMDEAVERERTMPSAVLVAQLLTAAEERWVPLDPATERAVMKPAIVALTVEQCHAALREAWSRGELSIKAVGNVDLGPEGEKQLAAAWAEGEKLEVTARAEVKAQGWGYASETEQAGKVAAREHDEEFDFHDVRFENGVRLVIKRTDFDERQILVRALIGEGGLSLEPTQSALRVFAQATFAGGGLGKHSADDLRRLTAGKAAGVQFSIGEDAFGLTGATTAEDLLLQCELACAYATDPGWREDGATAFRRVLPQIYESQKHQPSGPLTTEFTPKLYGHDPRSVFPAQETLAALTMEDVKPWLGPQLAEGPLTVVVAGKVEVDAAIAAVARTFGALPKRRAPLPFTERRTFPPMAQGLRETYTIDSAVPKTLVYAQFQTTDGIDSAMRRKVFFLTNVVNDRLRLEIREKLGASYSPSASNAASRAYPGHGSLTIQALTEPAGAERLLEAVLAVADGLAKDGVTDEEVERLRPEGLAVLRDQQRQNGFWLETLGGLHLDRPVRQDLRTLIPQFETISAKELTELAKKYLPSKLASVAVVKPAGAAAPEPPKPPDEVK